MLLKTITWSYDRRRPLLALWIVALVALSALSGAAGGEARADYSVPGSDSARALTLLDDRFPEYSGATADVVIEASDGIADPQVAERVEDLSANLRDVPGVVGAELGPVSNDGSTGLVQVRFDAPTEKLEMTSVQEVMARAEASEGEGITIELGGYPITTAEQEEAGSESIGLLAALGIMLLAFGSAVAAALPLVIAVFGLGVSLGAVWLVANVLDVPDFGIQIATMIGIGVGIDYALFIVTRYRSALAEGRAPRDAVLLAGTTAGRAVVFAGSTVVVSIFGLVLMGRSYLWGVAGATSIAVAVVVLAAVTLLPALLGFCGHRIDGLRLPWFRHDVDGRRTLSWRWSRLVQRHPAITGSAAAIAVIALALPAAGMRFGMPDAGNGPEELTTRRAYDLVSERFGPGANGPLLVAVDLSEVDTEQASEVLDRMGAELSAVKGVAQVLPPAMNPGGDAGVLSVIPATGPQDEATEGLVRTLRDDVLPASAKASGTQAWVGGTTASFIDDSENVASRLPLLIAGVVLASFVLLMSVFRSLAVAVKAGILNVLSIGAAYGVMTAAANGGWLGDLVGIADGTPVPGWLPMLMFAVLFGLSMDYEVFLLSRVREEYLRSRDNRQAVADGLAQTARVITAAAAIMVTVFGAFVLEDAVFLKLAGVGLATAVFVDATVIRMVLVPSTMELLGDRNWWLPGWLDRLLPRVDVEGAEREPIAHERGSAPSPMALDQQLQGTNR